MRPKVHGSTRAADMTIRMRACAQHSRSAPKMLAPAPSQAVIERGSLADRIDNWRRAYRWYRQGCAVRSLEGRYRPPRGANWADVPLTFLPGIDLLDAAAVEVAWGTLNCKARWVLKLAVHAAINRHDDNSVGYACRYVRRQCGVRLYVDEWDMHVISAKLDLRDALVGSERANVAAWREQCAQLVAQLLPMEYAHRSVSLAN